ncbi:MAG: PIN domain-containing protein [Myxococcales bacterium]|nr:PIN domain-containing protein [Myxococcales bacterium]
MTRYHLDTDFLVKALLSSGRERAMLVRLSDTRCEMEMSSIAWYEFCRGPRTPEQLARARAHLEADGIIPFTEDLAERAAELFRGLGSPRKRAADVAIACAAMERGARLLTGNLRDYSGLEGLALGIER